METDTSPKSPNDLKEIDFQDESEREECGIIIEPELQEKIARFKDGVREFFEKNENGEETRVGTLTDLMRQLAEYQHVRQAEERNRGFVNANFRPVERDELRSSCCRR